MEEKKEDELYKILKEIRQDRIDKHKKHAILHILMFLFWSMFMFSSGMLYEYISSRGI